MPAPSPQEIRDRVWDRLRPVALPDSRLHFDFAHMHPDFEGSAEAAERLMRIDFGRPLTRVFAAPDGALQAPRERLLTAGVTLVESTYRMRRGFRVLDPATIAPTDYAFAATLDGLERFGRPVDLAGLAALGRIDMLITGTAAIASNGVRFGRSYQYFDIEWALLAELGLVTEATPIVAFVHDVQVMAEPVAPMPRETVVDTVVTPTRTIVVDKRPRRPLSIDWSRIDAGEIEQMPALMELQKAQGLRR
jgi:5-formyltetrahydrofolate cyclo-ligase